MFRYGLIRLTPQLLMLTQKNEFEAGNAISKNQKRTQKRTQRKGYDRYQLRKKDLFEKLTKLGMMPEPSLFKIPALRANASKIIGR
jgi:CRISPR-associated endonuclease Csn1